jgi:hypothetical protein
VSVVVLHHLFLAAERAGVSGMIGVLVTPKATEEAAVVRARVRMDAAQHNAVQIAF